MTNPDKTPSAEEALGDLLKHARMQECPECDASWPTIERVIEAARKVEEKDRLYGMSIRGELHGALQDLADALKGKQ